MSPAGQSGGLPPELLPPGYRIVTVEKTTPQPVDDGATPARDETARGSAAGAGAVGFLATLLALAAKFKGALLVLLNLKWLLIAGKLLLSSGSLILSIWLWSTIFGWPFATGFVLLIFVHEMGHVIALYARGIRASVPIFIPFFGAFVALREMPPNARIEAEIAIAGPLLGTAGAAVCHIIGLQGGGQIWYALASAGYFINLFNLLPVIPLDGGRVVAALSPKLWVVGLVGALAFALLRPGPGIAFIAVMIALSWQRIAAAFHPATATDPYYQVPSRERIAIAVAYFGLAALAAVGWHAAAVAAGQ
jgi:Zn-dependent protease